MKKFNQMYVQYEVEFNPVFQMYVKYEVDQQVRFQGWISSVNKNTNGNVLMLAV